MEDVIQVNDQWYFAAGSHRADTRTQVLKQGDTFAVFDRFGEFGMTGLGEQGLYHRGMRHLNQWELLVNNRRPMLLNSTMKEDNSRLVVEFTAPDIHEDDRIVLHKGMLHLFRSLIVKDSALYEHLRLTNYSQSELVLELEYRFAADFHDMFEVRGVRREQRGQMHPVNFQDGMAVLSYYGLDGVERRTGVSFDGDILSLDERSCRMGVRLPAGAQVTLHATVVCSCGHSHFCVGSHSFAEEGMQELAKADAAQRATIWTSNEQFNDWLNRSVADLQMLITETVYGHYPYAGVPWFSTPFGRDGIITALQVLWLQPQLAKGALSFLAATQADKQNPVSESEPGKILHEMREGEMSALGEVPFQRYYGTIDATPLFVMLAGQYYRRTGDLEFIQEIWPNIERAVRWIDEWGDSDGDGFVEYQRLNSRGLVQQGWKDSDDSIFHADGSSAEGPIAVCEVQGYVYEAKLLAAELAELIGEPQLAERWKRQAAVMKEKFNQQFWLPDLGTFAIALDGHKRPCAVLNSNAGHALYCGIVDDEYAAIVASTITDARSFNGWGVRTIAADEPRYNPMSYHNGSVWPHDTAIIAAGLARYGYCAEALKLVTGLFEASIYLDLSRQPELFCGFKRIPGHGPTLYPVACSPQAWAAGSVFMLVQAILGLTFSPDKPQLRFDHPVLPDYLQWVKVNNLKLTDGVVDVTLRRHPRDVGLSVDRKEGDVDVIVIA